MLLIHRFPAAGSVLFLTTMTANRDPAVWSDADSFRPPASSVPTLRALLMFGGDCQLAEPGKHFLLNAVDHIPRVDRSPAVFLQLSPSELDRLWSLSFALAFLIASSVSIDAPYGIGFIWT